MKSLQTEDLKASIYSILSTMVVLIINILYGIKAKSVEKLQTRCNGMTMQGFGR